MSLKRTYEELERIKIEVFKMLYEGLKSLEEVEVNKRRSSED